MLNNAVSISHSAYMNLIKSGHMEYLWQQEQELSDHYFLHPEIEAIICHATIR